jgi:serine protease DegQ
MARATLYSRSTKQKPAGSGPDTGTSASASENAIPEKAGALKTFARRFEKPLLLAAGVLTAFLGFGLYDVITQQPVPITQRDIDAAVLHTLKKKPPDPSRASVAYGVISPSIVLVKRLGKEGEPSAKDKKSKPKKNERAAKEKAEAESAKKPDEKPNNKSEKKKGDSNKGELKGIGTGVVFSEDGMIFTCLHVIAGAERIGVVFGDGTESEVEIVSVQPENDLAVLKAKTLPDDLVPATLRSTKGLKVGDEVVAVGFPFGIGPSATSGVVSGLRREHFSEEGQRNLIDLIQFDAAANPGNSGGPLVTADGDVVGIVTSIMNPTDEGFFVGIGFAVPIENAASGAGLSPF